MCDPGYYDDDCKPCTVCDPGYWESQRCTQTSDTVCSRCTECEDNYRVTTACTYYSDTECSLCRACKTLEDIVGPSGEVEEGHNFFKSQLCEDTKTTGYEFPRSVYTLGADTVCQRCAEPEEGVSFVAQICDMYSDTNIQPCGVCECQDLEEYPGSPGSLQEAWNNRLKYETSGEARQRSEKCEYRSAVCVPGDYNTVGETTECTSCTPGEEGQWEVYACFADSDALWKDCATCRPGEYVGDACTQTSDVSCPDCNTDIPQTYFEACEDGQLRCTDPTDTTCESCKEGFMGPACCYHKYHGACGTVTTRERAANRGGFEGSTSEQFIQFCMELCDEFPTCQAFELKDDGLNLDESGPTPAFTDMRNSICYFKSAFTQQDCMRSDSSCDWETRTKFNSEDPSFDCYSNVCRQNSSGTRPKKCTLVMQQRGACSCPGEQESCTVTDENGRTVYEHIQYYKPAAYPVDGKPQKE
jgi:hypothetical protein